MPQVTKKAAPVGEPLRAYGPNGECIAESHDRGKTWKPTAAGAALEEARRNPVPRAFTRRIAAVVDARTPELDHRIATPFNSLHETDTLAGWAPYDVIADLDENALDGIVLPGVSASPERVATLKRVGRTVILDLGARTSLEGEEAEKLAALLEHVDAVTVPSEIFASRLRTRHPRVFVVPDLIRREIWHGRRRQVAPKRPFVKIGLPREVPDNVEAAVTANAEKYGERAIFHRFDWWEIFPVEEPDLYLDLDIVLLPAPAERHQVGVAPILPVMASGGCVIADRLWPLVVHGKTGYQIGRDTAINWTSTLNRAIQDSRLRIVMGRNASAQARRWTPENKLHQIALPLRLVVPTSGPVSYA